jgi:hypothetical protein
MKAYLAGPMSGLPDNNFPAFREAAEQLRFNGWTIINPVELDEDEGLAETAQLGDPEYKDALARDLRQLMDVDAIVLMPGYQNSKGAQTELSLARHYGLHIFYYRGNGIAQPGVAVGAGLFDETTFYIESDGGARRV